MTAIRRWDEAGRRLEFTPDFIQGGRQWQVRVVADDGRARAETSFSIAVVDTIRPPTPTIVDMSPGDGFTRLTLSQATDEFLDSPGFAGRTFDASVTAPDGAGDRLPVRVILHGFDGVPASEGWSGEFRIAPHDPMNSYWWGYADNLPDGPPAGAVRDYTVRRVLHLLEWVLRTYPRADPERVYIDGMSMGGAGGMTIGLLHARHFAWVSATIGQAIPRNHRPSRLAQLSSLWGAPDLDLNDGTGELVWERMDLTRVLLEEALARDQLLFLKHGKDDATIHFGAVVGASPSTGRTFYQALQASAVGHLAVWDEGGHGVVDLLLGDGWWQLGWNPIFDATSVARRDLALPAFSRSSLDRDPGDGGGNGLRPWDPETGYAGDVAVPGDTGWRGDLAGALNRSLRWDSAGIVDSIERFEVPLRALDGDGGPPPAPGYPTTGDRLDGVLPATVDVTLRRTRAFLAYPGERLAWRFGQLEGEVEASVDGDVTIPGLPITAAWTTEPSREVPTACEPLELGLHELRQRAVAALLEPLEEAFEVPTHQHRGVTVVGPSRTRILKSSCRSSPTGVRLRAPDRATVAPSTSAPQALGLPLVRSALPRHDGQLTRPGRSRRSPRARGLRAADVLEVEHPSSGCLPHPRTAECSSTLTP